MQIFGLTLDEWRKLKAYISHNLRKPALKVIDDKSNNGLDDTHLTFKQDDAYIETHRLLIGLRRSNKITFKTKTTKLTKVPNSPYYRGVRLWDRISEETQRATTKVKFKQPIKERH